MKIFSAGAPGGSTCLGLTLTLVATVVIALVLPIGTFTVDEGAYLLQTESMVHHGSLGVENGQPSLEKFAEVHGNAPILFWVGDRLLSGYPPGQALLATPFFFFFGPAGLFLVNLLSVVGLVWLVSLLLREQVGEEFKRGATLVAILTAGFPLLLSGVSLWPHASSTFLIFAGFFFLLRRRSASTKEIFLSGILLGSALFLRYDSALAIMVAGVFLLCRSTPMRSVLALSTGVLPFVLGLGVLNYYRFGVPHPFSYGPSPKTAVVDHLPFFLIVTSGLVAVALFARQRTGASIPVPGWVKVVGLGVFTTIAGALCPDKLVKLYGALFHFSGGSFRFELPFGLPVLGGQGEAIYATYRLALFQGAAVLAIGLFSSGRGVNSRRWEFLLVPAAYFFFFGLRGWHGGLSLEMRYFTPAVPFLSVLAGGVILLLLPRSEVARVRLAAFTVIAGLLLTFTLSLDWVILDLTTIVALVCVLTPFLRRSGQRVVVLLGASMTVAVSLYQAGNLLTARSRSEQLSTILAEHVEDRSALVMADGSDWLFPLKLLADADIASNSILGQEGRLLPEGYDQYLSCCIFDSSRARCQQLHEQEWLFARLKPIEIPLPGLQCWEIIAPNRS